MASNALTERLAWRVVSDARRYEYKELDCIDCGMLPCEPITGFCGHTRCAECVMNKKLCPCGSYHPWYQAINIPVRNIIHKINADQKTTPLNLNYRPSSSASTGRLTSRGVPASAAIKMLASLRWSDSRTNRVMTKKKRLRYAVMLMKLGKYHSAARHLAYTTTKYVSCIYEDVAAGTLLRKSIKELLKHYNEKRVMALCSMARNIRHKVTPIMDFTEFYDMECPICLELMVNPVTIPCGHMFCRQCIEHAIFERKQCAMCKTPVDLFTVLMTRNTKFMETALKIRFPMEIPPPDDMIRYIPIFNCTVAYPTIPCPILTLSATHRNFVKKVIDSGTRRFGMVTTFKDGAIAACGTIVEVRDCVQLHDGRTILSTVGINRFRILDKDGADDHVAQVLELRDEIPTEEEYRALNLQQLAQSITEKVMQWLAILATPILSDIESSFGPMPWYHEEYRWWANPDSPKWLWWIITILPFSAELKVLMLSTVQLQKRMLAVSRTLDVILAHYNRYIKLRWYVMERNYRPCPMPPTRRVVP